MNLNEREIVQNSDLNRYPFRPVLGLKQPVLDLKRSELSKVEVAKPSGNFRSKSRFPRKSTKACNAKSKGPTFDVGSRPHLDLFRSK